MRARLATAVLALGLALIGSASSAAEGRFLLVVSGLGGEDYYRELFERWSHNLLDIAHKRYAMEDANTVYLAAYEGTEPERRDGVSRRKAVLAAIDDLARRSVADDRVVIVLIGHASAQGQDVRYNLPGPDLTPAALGQALDALEGRRLAIIVTLPASGAFLPKLSAPGRIVVTATANAAENQHTRFAGYFIDALAGAAADADKDGTISMLEAFRFARREVARAYEDEKRLLTEHAQLDDNGDGTGSQTPTSINADGATAKRFNLAGLSGVGGGGDSPVATARLKLQLQARRLVDRVERLKREKRLLGQEAYTQQLEALLVELALNRRAYREMTP